MSIARDDPAGVVIAIKAVPGAKRTEVVGRLGDRLKVRIAAPPEDGKANRAICTLLAEALNVPPRCVEIIHGSSSADKLIRVAGIAAAMVESRWPR